MVSKRTVDINTTRGLSLALPIEPDQRVLIIGEALRALLVLIQRTGAVGTLLANQPQEAVLDQRPFPESGPLPVDDGFAHHAIVVVDQVAHMAVLDGELARIVKPGGHVLVAVRYARPGGRASAPARSTPRRLSRRLAAGDFSPYGTFGVRQHLGDVRHLVPLQGAALRWYARSAYLPSTPGQVRVARVVSLPGGGWLHRALFPAIAVVARRQPGQAPGIARERAGGCRWRCTVQSDARARLGALR